MFMVSCLCFSSPSLKQETYILFLKLLLLVVIVVVAVGVVEVKIGHSFLIRY
jgi:hypothetical protein